MGVRAVTTMSSESFSHELWSGYKTGEASKAAYGGASFSPIERSPCRDRVLTVLADGGARGDEHWLRQRALARERPASGKTVFWTPTRTVACVRTIEWYRGLGRPRSSGIR